MLGSARHNLSKFQTSNWNLEIPFRITEKSIFSTTETASNVHQRDLSVTSSHSKPPNNHRTGFSGLSDFLRQCPTYWYYQANRSKSCHQWNTQILFSILIWVSVQLKITVASNLKTIPNRVDILLHLVSCPSFHAQRNGWIRSED